VKAEINVTPLVDIVLVLLIIFIVITPAVTDAVRLPAARLSAAPDRAEGRLVLALAARRDPAGKVLGPGPVTVAAREPGGGPAAFALADPAGRAGLAALIRAAAARSRDLRVFIKADFDLPFKHVNDLLQLCREAGAGEAAVVTREDRNEGSAGPGGA